MENLTDDLELKDCIFDLKENTLILADVLSPYQLVEGEIGLEVESEYVSPVTSFMFPDWDEVETTDWVFCDYWFVIKDGSLKKNGLEFVLNKPCHRDEVGEMLEVLKEELEPINELFYKSIRAGVHIHVNMQDMTFEQIKRYVLLYYLLEGVFLNQCGDNRKGNLFCLRLKDAQSILEDLSPFICNKITNKDEALKSIGNLYHDGLRYSSLNLKPLSSYGSVEFRAMPSEKYFEGIEFMADLLINLKDYAKKDMDLKKLPELISSEGPDFLLNDIFGEEKSQKLYYEDYYKDLMESLRLIQSLIYFME